MREAHLFVMGVSIRLSERAQTSVDIIVVIWRASPNIEHLCVRLPVCGCVCVCVCD